MCRDKCLNMELPWTQQRSIHPPFNLSCLSAKRSGDRFDKKHQKTWTRHLPFLSPVWHVKYPRPGDWTRNLLSVHHSVTLLYFILERLFNWKTKPIYCIALLYWMDTRGVPCSSIQKWEQTPLPVIFWVFFFSFCCSTLMDSLLIEQHILLPWQWRLTAKKK